MWGIVNLENDPNGVSWTQLYGVFGKRLPPSARQFVNTLRMTNSTPIGSSVQANISLVAQNESRCLLIMQNNSTAIAPDVAPTMYFGFGTNPVIGQDLALDPDVGIVLDVRVPIDAIYVALGPFSNSGNTVVIQGVIKEGTITDPERDTANISETGQLAQLIELFTRYLAGG